MSINIQYKFSSYFPTNMHVHTHTLLMVKHDAHTAHTCCQRQKNEAAERYGNGLYGGHGSICGWEGTREVKYYEL